MSYGKLELMDREELKKRILDTYNKIKIGLMLTMRAPEVTYLLIEHPWYSKMLRPLNNLFLSVSLFVKPDTLARWIGASKRMVMKTGKLFWRMLEDEEKMAIVRNSFLIMRGLSMKFYYIQEIYGAQIYGKTLSKFFKEIEEHIDLFRPFDSSYEAIKNLKYLEVGRLGL